MRRTGVSVRGAIYAMFALMPLLVRAQYRYDRPTPLPSTPEHHPAQRVILLNIEGMHALDLALWTEHHPRSALAQLAARGVMYTNARVPYADGAAGRLAMITGGTPITTGVLSGNAWDRTLSPPGSGCSIQGAAIHFGARISLPSGRIDPDKLPLDPRHGCVPVYPHSYVRVNTAFELVRAAGGRTAWADEDPAIGDLFNGPSGHGVADLYTPAVEVQDADGAIMQDRLRLSALQNEIAGRDHSGQLKPGVPTLFGMTFAAFRAAEQQPGGGYADGSGRPSDALNQALQFIDDSIGGMVSRLKARGLYDSTFFFITSAFGEAPMDPSQRRSIDRALLARTVDTVQPGLAAHVSGGSGALIWLKDARKAADAVNALRSQYAELGIANVYSGRAIGLRFNSPVDDPRMPDIILAAQSGVLWQQVGSTRRSAAGGQCDATANVPVLVSGSGLNGRIDKTEVPTSQIAPAILKALGMEKFGLLALHGEHTPAIPDIF